MKSLIWRALFTTSEYLEIASIVLEEAAETVRTYRKAFDDHAPEQWKWFVG